MSSFRKPLQYMTPETRTYVDGRPVVTPGTQATTMASVQPITMNSFDEHKANLPEGVRLERVILVTTADDLPVWDHRAVTRGVTFLWRGRTYRNGSVRECQAGVINHFQYAAYEFSEEEV